MYYINYYAQPKPKTTEEEMIKEFERTRNLIRTKLIENLDDFDIFRNISHRNIQKAYSKFTRAISLCRNITRDYSYNGVYHASIGSCYRTFRIPKQSGGYRTITAPVDTLKDAQREILNMLTHDLKVLPHNAAHGCTNHRNCLTALKVHQANNSKWFLKVDLKDAFGSVLKDQLINALREHAIIRKREEYGVHTTDIVAICMHEGITGLPQGAPTSPLLLNLYLQHFDDIITRALRRKGIVYTRYVDDMIFSCRVSFNYTEILELIRESLPTGMEIKPEKTRYGNFNWKNWNLGIMYNNLGQLTVGHKNKKLIKNRVHNYNTRPELQSCENYMQLNGLINYYRYIEPEYFSDTRYTLVKPTLTTITLETAGDAVDIEAILEELPIQDVW